MKRNRLLITAFLMLLASGTPVCVLAQGSGTSCSDPIQITKDFSATIHGAGAVWYVANTFDLPLAIDFYPSNPADKGPVLEMDFGCTPGVYDDPILCSLFCATNPGYIVLPYVETPQARTDKDGKLRYHVEMGEFYRDMLLRQGIDYNVRVFVKATFFGGGTIGISPDPFSTCMDGAKFMHLGDTVQVKAQDTERHVIVPYVQWQYDSIRYVWSGDERVTLAVMGKNCDFDPLGNDDENMLQWKRIQPGDTLKMTSADIRHYLEDNTKQKDGGLYYAKFYSNSAGIMKIERIPETPAEGEAVVLAYDKETSLKANPFGDLYAIPQSWTKATLFTTPTDFVFRMYIGATAAFTKEEAIASYQFDKTPDGHQLGLLEEDMNALWAQAKGKYLYVRFDCSQATTVLPSLWTPSLCLAKSTLVKPKEEVSVAARSKTTYRLLYADWQGGDMTIEWKCNTGNCPFFIGDSCISASEEDAHVFYSDKVGKNSSVTIPAADIASWASHVDGEGNLYVRFNPNNKGTITMTTTAEEEKDPEDTKPDIPHATVHVSCADGDPHMLLVTVSVPQTLTVTADGTTVEQWEATPAEPHTLTLSAGQYTLTGTKEEVLLLVP